MPSSIRRIHFRSLTVPPAGRLPVVVDAVGEVQGYYRGFALHLIVGIEVRAVRGKGKRTG